MSLIKKSLFVCLLCIFFTAPNFVDAEVKKEQLDVEFLNDFVLEPAKNEVILNPGEVSTKRISVINRTEREVAFTIDIEDVVGSNNQQDQVKLLGDEKGPYSLKDFLVPEIREFNLKPGEKITIPVLVSLPNNSEPRGYYGAVIISAEDIEEDGHDGSEVGSVTKIVTRLGSIFLVRVNGDLIEESSIHDFKTIGPKSFFYSNHPTGFEVAINNEGNVHLVHYGEVTIKNILGKTVDVLPMNAFFSLPDSVRYREVSWKESFSMGYYTAELALYKGFGDKNDLINSKVSFFVLPWQVIVPIILGIAVLFFIIRFLKNNFKFERRK